MKIKRTVTITKTVEVDVDNNCFTEEMLNEFESYMFTLDEKNTRKESLISYICGYLAQYEDSNFVEGIGRVHHKYSSCTNETSVISDVDVTFECVETDEY
jgi:hypothetical protein